MHQSLRSYYLRRAIAALGVVACSILFAPQAAEAATINWGAPTTISGDADVSQNGTFVAAANLDGAATTVNGVAFQGSDLPFGNASVNIGSFNVSGFFNNFAVGTGPAVGSAVAPFANLGAAYQTLLGSATLVAPAGAPQAMTLTINGLTVGQLYEFQAWANDSRASNFTYPVAVTAGNAVTLNPSLAGAEGGVGQFVIGTFVADAAAQVVTFHNDEFATVNGFQIRAIAAQTVTVPTLPPLGYALLALLLSGAAYGLFRHRRDD